MRVLLTGGGGFIGSFIGERLLKEGYEVTCLDNFNNFYDPEIKKKNLISCISHKNFELCYGDILDLALLRRLFRARSFDMVIHLAAWAGVRRSIEQPRIYQKVNIEGTLNLLEQCKEYKVDKFILASSSSVYGGNTQLPFKETDQVDNPISPYAATKKAAELLSYTYHRLYGINIVCLRYFTIYGPRQRPEMAIHKFTRMMCLGEPIPMFGDGTSSRDYTYIDDAVEATIKVIDKVKNFEIFNIGSGRPIMLRELIDIISTQLKIKPEILTLRLERGEVMNTHADISKAQKILGYQPKVKIEEGIEEFIKWFKIEEQ
jgi:UDP-glucuronate 4-epimerase